MTLDELQRRRHKFIHHMAEKSAALFFAANETIRNADNTYPFRQNSNFWYFTEFNEPEALLLLLKKEGGQTEQILFNRQKDKEKEIWHGRRLGQDAACIQLAVDEAFPYETLTQKLPELLTGITTLYHAFDEQAHADNIVNDVLAYLAHRDSHDSTLPTVTDWRPWVHEMRLIKSDEEIMIMRQAAEISAKGHMQAMRACRPGLYEYHLAAEIEHEFARHGARYPSYNTIVGSGENGCILHYMENSDRLRSGDLVLIDAGCEYQGYAGDISRTWPVNGKFTPEQRAIYTIVLQAQKGAIARLVPGSSIKEANQYVIKTMIEGLIKLGILEGSVDALIANQAHRQFYMHGLGHWLGLDVHDVGDYVSSERDRSLEPGMVLTVEPGLYIAEAENVPAAYHNIGIRIEDNIVITATGNEVLTSGVVKEIAEIEAVMAEQNQ